MRAMIHETNTYPGMKRNEDGRLRRCGSSLAERDSCHHPASTAAKIQFWLISECTMNAGPSSSVKPLRPLSTIV